MDSSSCCHAEKAVKVARVCMRSHSRKRREEGGLSSSGSGKVKSQSDVSQVGGRRVCTVDPETEHGATRGMAVGVQSLGRAVMLC